MTTPDLRSDRRRGALPPLRISPSTLLTVVVIAVLVHPALVYSGTASGIGAVGASLLVGIAVILSVLLHEVAHAGIARAFGAHVDHIALTLWGGHTQYRGRRIGPGAAMLISLAGPAANGLIGAACALAAGPLAGGPAGTVLFYVSSMNYALAIFNLLPGLPMDGGRALESLIGMISGRRALGTLITAWIGRGIAALVLIVPLVRAALGQRDYLVLVWAAVIAAILWQGAGDALRGARTERRVARLEPAALVRPVVLLAPSASAAEIPSDPRPVLVLDAQGDGHRVDPAALASVPAAERSRTPVLAVARREGPAGSLRTPLGDGDDLVAAMLEDRRALYVVLDGDGHVMGTISWAEVNAHLREPAT